MAHQLSNFTWQQIISLYKFYGGKLHEIYQLAKRLNIKLPLEDAYIVYKNSNEKDKVDITLRMLKEANKYNNLFKILDREIIRRKKMVGAMG